MNFRLRFLAFALGTGLVAAAPTAAQAQISVGVNIGQPAWGPPVPQNTQYYYIPEIDGYYDIYNGTYLVFDGQQWITQPYIDGYDPYYFHPVPVSYVGPQPWLYISTYRNRYPQYVTGYRRGGFGGQYHGNEYGAGRVYGYDHGGLGNRGNVYNGGRSNVYNGNRGGFDGRSAGGGQSFPGGQGNRGGNFGGGQPGNPGGGQPGGQQGRGNFGGGQPGNPGGGQQGRGGQQGGGGQQGRSGQQGGGGQQGGHGRGR